MSTVVDVVTWPSVRDVALQLGVTHAWVLRLIERGELYAVRTRLGRLVDPESVRDYAAARPVRQGARPA